MINSRNLYGIPDVKPGASSDEIKVSYRKLAIVHHPYKTLIHFKMVSVAYHTAHITIIHDYFFIYENGFTSVKKFTHSNSCYEADAF